MVQKAVSSKPKFVVVLGLWLLFGPQIPWLILVLIMIVSDIVAPAHVFYFRGGASITYDSDRGAVADVLMLAGILALLAIYGSILWKVTSRYCEPLDTDEEPDTDEPVDTDEEV
jgi:hypothetical protein